MSDLLAVYVDGETKTGKGAAGKAIARALEEHGLRVYYDVAGDFYRRYVAWVRLDLGLADTDLLPLGSVLEETASKLYMSGQAFKHDETLLGDLQRPAISESVSKLGELPIAQQAGIEWWGKTLQLAAEEEAEALVLDGRNPRLKVREAQATVHIPVRIVLDLFMICEPEVAGRRLLAGRGISNPDKMQLEAATREVEMRRQRDRQRPVHPFVVPNESVPYDLAAATAEEVIRKSWQLAGATDVPVAIQLNNSHLAMDVMLGCVSELAATAVDYLNSN